MGATDWRYYTKYDPDPEVALKRLHKRLRVKSRTDGVGEEGTGTALDICGIAPRRSYATAAPFPKTQLKHFFGTTTPGRAEVEDNWIGISDLCERDTAYYLVVYRDGEPHQYAFIGCSGD